MSTSVVMDVGLRWLHSRLKSSRNFDIRAIDRKCSPIREPTTWWFHVPINWIFYWVSLFNRRRDERV